MVSSRKLPQRDWCSVTNDTIPYMVEFVAENGRRDDQVLACECSKALEVRGYRSPYQYEALENAYLRAQESVRFRSRAW
jgi:hypothetical protein